MTRKIVLFEDAAVADLLPLTYWRSVFELRWGRKVLVDRAAQRLETPISGLWTRDWIGDVAAQRCGLPTNGAADDATVLVNGRWIMEGPVEWASAPCVGEIAGEAAYVVCDAALAARLDPGVMLDRESFATALAKVPRANADGMLVRYPWEFVSGLRDALMADWSPKDAGCEGEHDRTVLIDAAESVHIGNGAGIHPTAVIDADEGPVFIGERARIGAHCVIEGPAYIGPGTRINPHAWIHGGNSFGPMCKLGGEIDGCVIMGYSNKQHAGFLGHSYVGSWVNLGAGTTNSDLKNTYGNVRVPIRGTPVDTGGMCFGAIIADHVKTAINTTIPTGAVIGTAANVMCGGIAPRFVPPFAWITADGTERGDVNRLVAVAAKVMARRGVTMSPAEEALFRAIATISRDHESPG